MSQENVEVVRAVFEAFLSRDLEASNQLLADDIEWDTTRIVETVPDLAGVYRGVEEHRTLWRAWLSPWSKLDFDYELLDAGDEIIGLVRNQRQWGRHSGAVTNIPDYAWVYTVRDGEVTRGCFYPDHQSALEAHGLA